MSLRFVKGSLSLEDLLLERILIHNWSEFKQIVIDLLILVGYGMMRSSLKKVNRNDFFRMKRSSIFVFWKVCYSRVER